MKRTLITLVFLATFGMALAGPPVDVQLMCGAGEGATLVGVAILVEDELHVSLIDGALETCGDSVFFGVVGDETVFTLSYGLEDGVVTVVWPEDAEYTPALTYEEVPAVAVEGMLGAQQNRAMALGLATQARERAAERAGGPPIEVPGGGDDDEVLEAEVESDDGPPADLPVPASPGRP